MNIFWKRKYFQVFGCIRKKCFRKYFWVFCCVCENASKNTFSISTTSHFPRFLTDTIIENSNLKIQRNKKWRTKPEFARERERERDWEGDNRKFQYKNPKKQKMENKTRFCERDCVREKDRELDWEGERDRWQWLMMLRSALGQRCWWLVEDGKVSWSGWWRMTNFH